MTEGTITSDGDTLIPLMDLEAGQPGKPAVGSTHSKHDSSSSGGSHKGQHGPWGLSSPERSHARDRGDVDAIEPAPKQTENTAKYNVIAPTARSSDERSSEEYIGELGVGVPSPSDYISPWEGPSFAASADPNLHLGVQSRRVDQPVAQLSPAAQQSLSAASASVRPTNIRQLSEQKDGAISITSEGTRATTAGLDDTSSFAGSRAQLTASFAGSRAQSRSQSGDVNKPLPPLPLHSRVNQYQQRWL